MNWNDVLSLDSNICLSVRVIDETFEIEVIRNDGLVHE